MKRLSVFALACVLAFGLCFGLTSCQTQSYTPSEKEQTVPDSALGKSGTLRVGVNASSAPLAGQTSSSSRIVGIDVDAAAYIADQMGVKVEIVDVGNDPTSALTDGNVDVVLGVDSAESDSDYWRSDPYLQTGVALFGGENETTVPALNSKPKIAAQASSRSSWRVSNLFGDESLSVQGDLKSAFDALANGSVQYVAADAIIGSYVSYSNGFADKIVALLQDPSGYCAAVAKQNTELQSAVAAAMSELVNGGMMDIIEKKWLGTEIDLSNVPVLKSSAADSKKSDKSAKKDGEEGEEGEETEAPEGDATDGETSDGEDGGQVTDEGEPTEVISGADA